MAEYTLTPTQSEALFDHDGTHADEPDEPATCQEVVERTGEPCGRDRPCRYHD